MVVGLPVVKGEIYKSFSPLFSPLLNFFPQILSGQGWQAREERRERCVFLACFSLTAAAAKAVVCLLWKQGLGEEAGRGASVPSVGQWGDKTSWELQAPLFERKTREKFPRQ